MAQVIRNEEKKASLEDEAGQAESSIEKVEAPPTAVTQQPISVASGRTRSRGFFTIYKTGQGYWTRMGTVFAAALVGVFTAYNLYAYIPSFINSTSSRVGTEIGLGVAAVFLASYSLLVFWLMNKPDNADFLIATDSEMKKVNWTSRKELIGSTKIVILFMFVIALFLFLTDVVFGYFMFLIRVLHNGPFG